MRNSVLLALVTACVAGSAVAQVGNCTRTDSTGPDCPGAIPFFRSFQLALRKNDRQKVASLVTYPVLTTVHHKRVRIRNRTQLLAYFDDIFDEGVRCAILSARRTTSGAIGEGSRWTAVQFGSTALFRKANIQM